MNQLRTAFAKLAGVRKIVGSRVENRRGQHFDPPTVKEYFEIYVRAAQVLRDELPEIFGDLLIRPVPESSGTTDFDGRGYVKRASLEELVRDIEYILEVRAHSELEVPMRQSESPARCFISHGRSPQWRELQAYLEKDLNISTLELAQEPNKGRTILQKLNEEAEKCCYAIIIMTGEDRTDDGQIRARENVIHEIGYFQGKFGLSNVCLLHEEGVSIPSNIHGLVYIPFPPASINSAFGVLTRELKTCFNDFRLDL
jgi:predicted nucleotide-binding protein